MSSADSKLKLDALTRQVAYSGEGLSVRSLEDNIHRERTTQNNKVQELSVLRERNVEIQKSLADEVGKLRKFSDYLNGTATKGGFWAGFKELVSYIPGLRTIAISQRSIEELLKQQYQISARRVKEAADYVDILKASEQDLYKEIDRINGKIIPSPTPGRRIFAMKEPVGVCAIITPWNFPIAMITRKVAPGLAAGCTMVVKPSDFTPYSALALAVLAERAGIPAGVLNILTGKPEAIGAELTSNPVVRKLSFTGSTRIGALLAEQCAPTLKRLSLELGGNAPFVVFDDADLDAAVEGAMVSKFRNSGQTCVCANRIYVQAGVYDAFAEKLKAAVEKLNVGDGLKDGITTGPLINTEAVAKVEEHIKDVLDHGGAVLAGGKRHALGGSFFEPTIVTGVTQSMKVAQEETFGPLAPLFRFETEEEVLGYANDTIFGLACYFYARDVGRITRVQEGLEYGIVGVNTGIISTEVAPFGGVKQSGLGREGSHHGIDDYLELKYICLSI